MRIGIEIRARFAGAAESFDPGTPLIKIAYHVRRDEIFRSLFDRVRKLAAQR
jgi:hypothetical protein